MAEEVMPLQLTSEQKRFHGNKYALALCSVLERASLSDDERWKLMGRIERNLRWLESLDSPQREDYVW